MVIVCRSGTVNRISSMQKSPDKTAISRIRCEFAAPVVYAGFIAILKPSLKSDRSESHCRDQTQNQTLRLLIARSGKEVRSCTGRPRKRKGDDRCFRGFSISTAQCR
jgi:hypothetical protein